MPRRSHGLTGCCALIAACIGDADRSGVVRVDSAGVEIVTNGASDSPVAFYLEREWGLDGDGALEVGELMPWHVSADAAGRVYVLDEIGKRVLVLNEGGVIHDTLGRAGSGPGELARPISVHVAEDGTVGVWDYGQGGLARWRDGASLPLQRAGVGFWGADVRIVNEGVAFVSMSREGAVRQRLVISDSLGAITVAELAPAQQRPAEFPTCGIRGIPIPPLFAVELNWDVSGARVFASTSASYEIEVREIGRSSQQVAPEFAGLRAIWRRAMPPRAASEALALREVGEGLPIPVTGCVVPPMEVVRGRGYAEVVPAIRRIVADREGRLWVLRGGLSDEPNRVDLLDLSGAYLGTLPEDAPIPVAFPGRGRLVGLEKDSTGIRVLSSWRIIDR